MDKNQFPQQPLSDFFSVRALPDAEIGDIIVQWSGNSNAFNMTMIKNDEQKNLLAETPPPSRTIVLTPLGDITAPFLVAWSKTPVGQRELGIDKSGRFVPTTANRARDMLTSNIPIPNKEAWEGINKIISAADLSLEQIQLKRQMCDTQEKLILAVTNQMLSGKIPFNEAKNFIAKTFSFETISMKDDKKTPKNDVVKIKGP